MLKKGMCVAIKYRFSQEQFFNANFVRNQDEASVQFVRR